FRASAGAVRALDRARRSALDPDRMGRGHSAARASAGRSGQGARPSPCRLRGPGGGGLADERGFELSDLQALIARAIRSPRTLVTDPYWVDVAERCFTRSDGMSPVERLEIYREQFWLRHTACLLEDYPALSALLGQADWERLVE